MSSKLPSKLSFPNLIISLSFLLAGIAIAYYLVLFLPQQTKRSQEAQEFNQSKLNECLSNTDKQFSNWLNENKDKKVSNDSVVFTTDFIQKQKDECFKRYPVK